MHTIINLRCVDQVLAFDSTPIIASGGVDEVTVHAAFCPKWDGLVKTAVFWRNERDAYHVLLDEHGRCAIPPEVLIDEGRIYLGFFGVDAEGKQRTSQVVSYSVHKGAITYDSAPNNPTADLYTQLLAKYVAVVDIATAIQAEEKAFEQRLEEMFRTGVWNDAYTKVQTLSAETRNLYGADLDAVPDDIFRSIDSRFAKIATGSYIGTGEATKSLTFDFVPKFVFVYYANMGNKSGWNPSEFGIYPCFREDGSLCFAGVRDDMDKTSMVTTLSGTTLTWTDTKYNTYWDADSEEEYPTADCALNASGCKYRYIAIG